MPTVRLVTFARAGFLLGVLIIVLLSLVPGELRPHTGASGHVEHFGAYAATAFLAAQGLRLRGHIICAVGLAALSAAVEIAQMLIPGRNGEFAGFFYSTLGAWLGLLAGSLAWSARVAWRTRRRS
jgi:hypothetical protein